jgi:two-component system phosphate regulon sensor histidine kinase PhoR
MQLTTPKSISITLTFLLLILATGFYFSFNTVFSQDLKWWNILLLVLLFLWLYYTIAKWFLTNYIHRKVKLIYKSLRREKGASDDVETDLKKVSDEVDELVTERQKEIEELKVMENFRREFLGNVSHELKTPIFNIQGYIHTLLDGALHDETVNMRYLARTSKSVDRMINIVEDLEMISKLNLIDWT